MQKAQGHRNDTGYRTFRQSLTAGKIELTAAFVLIVAYFYARALLGLGLSLELAIGTTAVRLIDIVLVLGFLMGTWLAFRPSEWAVEGIESGAGHLVLTTYVAGMLTSLASNLPEAVVSGFSAYSGFMIGGTAGQELRDISVISVLIAAGFNMILLGVTIIVLTKGKKDIEVPIEAIRKDSVLMRWTIVALASMFALGVLELAAPTTENPSLPAMGSFVLMLSYVIYAVALAKGKVSKEAELAEPHHTKKTALFLAIAGIAGIFIAGEMLTSSVEILLDEYRTTILAYGVDPVTLPAVLLGAAGALPEHGIALIAASKGKMGIAIGNLLGGVLQIVLLVMGGIGIFVPIPLDRYVLFQIVAIAGSLYFLKRTITDDQKLDLFEGALIILLQAYVFTLLLT